MTQQRTIYLTPPRISPEHIQEKIICIRAHRERIFQVSATFVHDKLICNNYGHGGAGWTFLFGCVNESLRKFTQQCIAQPRFTKQPIAIIGAGCHGILTAIMLARQGHTVRIIAAQITAIASYKAAGFFFPRARKSSTDQERALFERLGIESYAMYRQIILKKHPFITQGPQMLPAYYGCDLDPGFAPYIDQGLMEKSETVTIDFGNGKQYQAIEYATIFINASIMMEELNNELKKLQITITQQTITDFSEIPEQVIFNCAGRDAGSLVGDTRIVPVQGHLIMLKNQPDMSSMQYMINVKVVMKDSQGKERYELIYYAPKANGILGITFIRGQNSLTANQHEFDRLLQRSMDFFGPADVE